MSMWSSITNKWWSVQVRLQKYNAVEVHYYDAKYTAFTIEGTRVNLGDFTFGFLSITENGFFTQRERNSKENHYR